MKTIEAFCCRTVSILFGIYSFIIVIICLFFNDLDYAYKKNFILPNILLLCAGFLFVCLCFRILKKLRSCISHAFCTDRFMICFSVIFFVFLCFLCSRYYFKTGWDVKYVLDNSELIASGSYSELCHWYFSRYPNNILLTYLFALVIRSCSFLHISNYYLVLIYIQCMIYAYIAFLLYRSVCLLLNDRLYALTAYMLYLGLVGLSPWVVIPYSDSIGLFFVLTIFYLYLRFSFTKKPSLIFFIAFLSYMGMKIKPQVIIITIAIIIISFCRILSEKCTIKDFLTVFTAAFIGLLTAFILVQAAARFSGLEINKEESFSLAHYAMMGLNTESNGEYSQTDVDFSASFTTRRERTDANLSTAKERLKAFTPGSFFLFIIKKLLAVYNDGSFAWNGEGYFFLECYEGGFLHKVLTHIYYPEGRLYPYYLLFVQALWMSTLFLSLFSGNKTASGTAPHIISVLKLSLIGLFLFEIIFEARARYLFTYTPIFILMACLGLHAMALRYSKPGTRPS
ncbi:MAG: hypothetical protein J6C64_14995 [Lachnospiraceae bacterium]|nr:hypothetical protein [Lachnospiraceae bacterium]